MLNLESKIENLKIENGEEPNELELYGLYDGKVFKKDIKPHKITLKLIMDRNMPKKLEKPKIDTIAEEEDQPVGNLADLKAQQLLKLTHIHLDRENIDEIDNLAEYLGDITHLYLQHNLITKIENLEFFQNLKFLVLSNNQIEIVENLQTLKSLKLLDLSYNQIKVLDVKELPMGLCFLNLVGNPCTEIAGWRDYELKIKSHLRRLIQLNENELDDDDGDEIEEKEDEIENNEDQLDTMERTQQEIVKRSQDRQKNDKVVLDKAWQQKKNKLELVKKDIDKKFEKCYSGSGEFFN